MDNPKANSSRRKLLKELEKAKMVKQFNTLISRAPEIEKRIETLSKQLAVASQPREGIALTAKKQSKTKKVKYPTYEEVVEIHKYIMSGEGNISPRQKLSIDKMNANLKPRPLERIPLILDVLKTIWEKYPDQRLGQLLENYVFLDGSRGKDKTSVALYAQEDTETLKNLQKIIKERVTDEKQSK
jgi:hypothetical protein